MPNQNTITEPLWKEMATMPAFHGGLLTESHRQALVGTCLRDYHNNLATTLPECKARSGGLILPEGDFDSLMGMNGRIRNHGPIYRQTLWALYRDLLDRDGTSLFWRMYYCNRKGPEWVDGKSEMVKQNRCYSLFCPSCRKEIQRRRVTRAKKHFGHLPMNRLYFLTVLHKCATDLDRIKSDIAGFKGKVKRAIRKAEHLSQVEMQGAMEIDLKHPSLYEVATMDGSRDYRQHCADALGALGIHLGQPDCPDKFWLIHYHAIVDIGQNTPKQVKDVLKNAFSGNHRVRLDSFHSVHKTPKKTSLNKCATYPLKSKLQYAENIYADDPDKDNKSCYGEAYTPEDMAYLCKAVDDGGNLELMKYDYGSRGNG
jgi:hypothetical protein